jgi:pimeloyl-ACP methyl ester carboxylesterase
MTQASKGDLFGVALPIIMYVYVMVVVLASIEYYSHGVSQQAAMVIIVGGSLGFAGAIAFAMAIDELAYTRRLRVIDIVIYALLATLYALFAGMVLAYYRELQVVEYSILGIVSVFVACFIATELLGRLPN